LVKRTPIPDGCPASCRAAVAEFNNNECTLPPSQYAQENPGSACFLYDHLRFNDLVGIHNRQTFKDKQKEHFKEKKTQDVSVEKILLSQPLIMADRLEQAEILNSATVPKAVEESDGSFLVLQGNVRTLALYRKGATSIRLSVMQKKYDEARRGGLSGHEYVRPKNAIALTEYERLQRIVPGNFDSLEMSMRCGLLTAAYLHYAETYTFTPFIVTVDDGELIYGSGPAYTESFNIPERWAAKISGKYHVIDPPWNPRGTGKRWVWGVESSKDLTEPLRALSTRMFYLYDHGRRNRREFQEIQDVLNSHAPCMKGHPY